MNPEQSADHDTEHVTLQRAIAFAQPLLTGRLLSTGEEAMGHAQGVAGILSDLGAGSAMQASAYLVYAADSLQKPDEVIAQAFGSSHASLVSHTRKLVQIQRAAHAALRQAETAREDGAAQLERVRKMLLAFSQDLRVVLMRLASRLQTLRWHAASKTPCPPAIARESRDVFAPLANRLGIWQIKWELEDLAFRFLDGDAYKRIARLLDEKRGERETGVQAFRKSLEDELQRAGIPAQVQGRPKHIYSIWKKMQGKGLDFSQLMDVRAMRIIVADAAQCYAALARVHECWVPVEGEFDDYIARPKPNGYQSLHTVVRDAQGRAVEVQLRTQAMHEHAEYGVAAHWAYKEAGSKGYVGVLAAGRFEGGVAEARKAVLRQLLAWEQDTSAQSGHALAERIYVFTPQASVVELAQGSTAVDFAYALHTELGHRCRGARIDGAMLPLTTPLRSGQTVDIISTREGGPSLDWLNPELGYLQSPRARAKVRAWFNAQELAQTVARGREAVERVLQREGRTALRHDDLAAQLGFKTAAALFEAVGKDELPLRAIELVLRPAAAPQPEDPSIVLKRSRAGHGDGAGIQVLGVGSVLTILARCCRPAPPDAVRGFVTRGKGVAVHRVDCSNLHHMMQQNPERVMAVEWGSPAGRDGPLYSLDVQVQANDRAGLLRDISEVFAREKVNVTGVKTQSVKDSGGATAYMTFTVEAPDAKGLAGVLRAIAQVDGVLHARRR